MTLLDMGHRPVTGAGLFARERLFFDPIEVKESGFAYIYVSYEGLQARGRVFFDDLEIVHREGTVVQADDYYPFGMTFNSYNRAKGRENQFLYNGKEKIEELDLGWYDYGARFYMPDIGRWGVVDALSDKYHSYSPYNYVLNNPLKFIDPDGNDVIIALGGIDYLSNGNTGSSGDLIANLNNWASENGVKDFSARAFAADVGDNVKGDIINYIRENYEVGSDEKLIIYGYSWGGDTGVEIAETLKEVGISVDLLVTVDAAKGPASGDLGDHVDREIPDNVKEVTNYYQTNPLLVLV